MYGESNMETYITMCKIDSQWEFAVWLRKLKQGLCINLEGGIYGERNIKTYITKCKINSQWELAYDSGN